MNSFINGPSNFIFASSSSVYGNSKNFPLKEKSNTRPLTVDGLVTSSCISPTLGKSIALGVLKNGRKRIGEKLHVYSLGSFYNATVCKPHFYDPESKNVNQ